MQAGATRVINPFSSGAIRMARFMLSPSIENFVEVLSPKESTGRLPMYRFRKALFLWSQDQRNPACVMRASCCSAFVRSSGAKFFPPPSYTDHRTR